MAEEPSILLFVPTYRCAPQIGRVLATFSQPEISDPFADILVLDNRSGDDTVQAAIEAARKLSLGKVSVARNLENYGLGGSHKAVFTYALETGYTHVAVLHGDDQGSIGDLLPVLVSGMHLEGDCWLGARFHPQARTVGYSKLRVVGNRIFNILFSVATRQRLFDLGSGLNLYRTAALSERYWWQFHDNLMFNYCMVLAHVARSDRMTFFPISWREDDQVSNVRLFSQAFRTLNVLRKFLAGRSAFFEYEFRETPRSDYRFEVLERRI